MFGLKVKLLFFVLVWFISLVCVVLVLKVGEVGLILFLMRWIFYLSEGLMIDCWISCCCFIVFLCYLKWCLLFGLCSSVRLVFVGGVVGLEVSSVG